MAQASTPTTNGGWLRTSGLLEIARALGLAVHPAKLGLALAGILATLLYGGLLDWLWPQQYRVPADAVARFIVARQLNEGYIEPSGTTGIFRAWREHERQSLLGFLGSPVVAATPNTPLGTAVEMRAALAYRPWYTNLADMGRGVWWMFRVHPVFFMLFALGALFIWALVGGAICRIAAVQFARDEKITAGQALAFAWNRLVGGFMLAPLIPIIFVALISLIMIIGGVFLRIPVLGDLLGAPLFAFALLGGFLIAILVIGLIVGGSLFWPAVAVEGSDAFDAFSRSLAYPFSRPWKALLYCVATVLYTVVCWLLVSLVVNWAILITRSVVSWGTSPFGWWRRDGGVSKLEVLWPLGGPSGLHQWPEWGQLGVFDKFSAFIIGIYVILAIALTWSFLFSFCFSSDTIIYFLLRRDVDGNDFSEIHMEEGAKSPASTPPVASGLPASASSAPPATTPLTSN